MRLLRYAPSDSSTYFEYASGVLGRKPCIHIRLDLLATNPCEKCGLEDCFLETRRHRGVEEIPIELRPLFMTPGKFSSRNANV